MITLDTWKQRILACNFVEAFEVCSVFADWLHDQGDPREMHVRDYLGRSSLSQDSLLFLVRMLFGFYPPRKRRPKCSDISLEAILTAIRAFHARQALTPDESLAHKYPTKVILAKMEKLARRGVLEVGVSLRTAWIVGDAYPPSRVDDSFLIKHDIRRT